MSEARTLKVKLVRSFYGRVPGHQSCVRGLGLRRIGQSIEVRDTPENRGMIDQVRYLLSVEGE